MAGYRDPKHEASRREGVHGQVRTRRQSEYGRPLRKKRRLKRYVGLSEKQLQHAFEDSQRTDEPTCQALLRLLESRLDNAVDRPGFVTTRPMAGQLVNHDHVLVNGRRVDIFSSQVEAGDTIAPSERASAIPAVEAVIHGAGVCPPSWLAREGYQPVGPVRQAPLPGEVAIPMDVDWIVRCSRASLLATRPGSSARRRPAHGPRGPHARLAASARC